MNRYQIAAFANLPRPTSVSHLAGRLECVFPQAKATGAVLQNMVLKDENSGAEVRIMMTGFSFLPIDPALYRGGYIELETVDEGAMVYRDQQLHNNKPQKPKVEIRQPTRVVRLLKASEYSGPLSLVGAGASTPDTSAAAGRSSGAASSPQAPAPVALPPRTVDFPVQPALSPESELLALAVLHLMCMRQATWVCSVAEAQDLKCSPREVLHSEVTRSLFIQATRDAVHRRLNLPAAVAEWDEPLAAKLRERPRSKVEQLIADIGEENIEAAERILRSSATLGADQTLHDLTEAQATGMLERRFVDNFRRSA